MWQELGERQGLLDLWGMYLRISLNRRICGKRMDPGHKLPLLNGKCGLAKSTTLSMGLN